MSKESPVRQKFLCMLFLAAAWSGQAQDAYRSRDPGLSVSKAVFEQKVQSADDELTARQGELNTWYTTTLKTLLRAHQERGELEPLLAVKSESERFEKERSVTGDNVVLFPGELTDAQRRYLTTAGQIRKDRQLKVARAVRAYLDDLEPAKRSLTKIGEIEAAVAVNDEIKRVKDSVDLSVLDKPEKDARPVGARAAVAETQPVTPVIVNPPGLRPLRDHIWVYALRNGFPVKDLKFTFFPSGANKPLELSTDQMGKITLRTDAASYQILLLSDKYEFQQVSEATAGNTYQFTITGTQPGNGVVYVKERERQIFLPGAGEVTVSQWRNTDGASGPSFRAQRPVFRLPKWNPKNINPVVMPRWDEPFHIIDGDTRYELTAHRIGPGEALCVRYTMVK